MNDTPDIPDAISLDAMLASITGPKSRRIDLTRINLETIENHPCALAAIIAAVIETIGGANAQHYTASIHMLATLLTKDLTHRLDNLDDIVDNTIKSFPGEIQARVDRERAKDTARQSLLATYNVAKFIASSLTRDVQIAQGGAAMHAGLRPEDLTDPPSRKVREAMVHPHVLDDVLHEAAGAA